MQDSYDTLIIGHGLAGSILAHILVAKGQRVMVLDHEKESTASLVAAGIINPITGHRLNITEGFEQLMPVALDFYHWLSTLFGATLYSPINQIRLIKNRGQFDYFNKRQAQSEYQSILGARILNPLEFVDADFGAAEVFQSGTVNTKQLLSLSRSFLVSKDSYLKLEVDYRTLNILEDRVEYDGINAARVVFCEGHRAINNPWLQNLPFKLAKGEILNLQLDVDVKRFLNWGNWLIPDAKKNCYRLGSTYDWHDLSLTSTKSASLLEGLRTHTGLHGHLVSVDVGIRPTTVHRKPFVGALNGIKNSFCFNGFGSKGCLLIPSYAYQLAEHIIHGKPLARELRQWL